MAKRGNQGDELRDYRERHGLSQSDLAAQLSERLKRTIKPSRIDVLEGGKDRIPVSYRLALGLDDEQQAGNDFDLGGGLDSDAGPDFAARADDPPMMPPGGRVQAPPTRPETAPGGELSIVRDRIAKAYNAIGAGASMATRNDGYAAVARAYSPELANAWANAAKENKNVAAIVSFMESGGPVGELVVCHLILVCGFIYVSGRAPALGTFLDDKFAPYHSAAASRRELDRQDAEAAEFNAARNGAAGPLGDAGRVAAA